MGIGVSGRSRKPLAVSATTEFRPLAYGSRLTAYCLPRRLKGDLVEYGTIPGLDKKVSRIVQGTVMLNSEDPKPGYALLDGVYAAGCTAFDTARHYGGGIEIVFGQWVRDRGIRDEVMLIGKGAHHSPERRRVTPQDIADDLGVSLGQFGLDYIDLYLLHRDDPDVPVGPIVEALAGRQRAGKIGAYGGSNWSHKR